MAESRSDSRTSFPLSAMFIILAACAVMCALLAIVVRQILGGELGVAEMVGAMVGGCLVVMCLGGVVGLYHYRRIRGCLWGALTGAVIGIFVGPLALAPPETLGSLLMMSLVGSAILLVTAATFRVSNSE